MARISKLEQLEERRTRVWELYNQGFTHTEIANNHLHYPRRTISNDVNFMKKKREIERRRMAELQQHQALEILEQEAVTMRILKRQAISDMSMLSIKEQGQRDLRIELY